MGAICCEANPVEYQDPGQLRESLIFAAKNRPVNGSSEVKKNSEDEDGDNTCFIIGGNMHESDESELEKYKNYDIVVEDERNFILKHKEDLEPAM